MDVIANNISNVNTVGYKSSRVTFNEVFTQTISSASAPNPAIDRGGVNPMQIGLGVGIASIDKAMATGAAQRTDNPLDLMIQGDGFFILEDGSGTYFTRAGNFIQDSEGFITLNGMKLMGWDSHWSNDSLEYAIDRSESTPLQISGQKEYMAPSITTRVDISGNINPNTDPVVKRTMSFYDSVGNKYILDVNLEYIPPDAADATATNWMVSFANEPRIYVNGDRSDYIEIEPIDSFEISFDRNGAIIPLASGDPPSYNIEVKPSGPLKPASTIGSEPDGAIALDFSGLNQFVNESTNAIAINKDGNAPGRLSGLSVGGDGKLTGRYSNGLTRTLGQIPIAQFKNAAGLDKVGKSLFATTPNSGEFDGIGVDGELQGGVLEMSNVDLSQEFTEMITTQRGFQANSRVITTSDDMLQELVNLKR
jgi:flagellar hook protein FlgE